MRIKLFPKQEDYKGEVNLNPDPCRPSTNNCFAAAIERLPTIRSLQVFQRY